MITFSIIKIIKNLKNNTDLIKNYAKMYDNNGDHTNECNNLYILSENLYQNAINKINLPFDVKFKNIS